MKVYRDGDTDLPTICGTGLEDYVGSAWGMGAPRRALRRRAARCVRGRVDPGANPDFVGFYRWHVPDPIMFERDLRVTIQQIGAVFFAPARRTELAAYEADATRRRRRVAARPRARRCSRGASPSASTTTAPPPYVYCREPQPVPRLDVAAALADIGRLAVRDGETHGVDGA